MFYKCAFAQNLIVFGGDDVIQYNIIHMWTTVHCHNKNTTDVYIPIELNLYRTREIYESPCKKNCIYVASAKQPCSYRHAETWIVYYAFFQSLVTLLYFDFYRAWGLRLCDVSIYRACNLILMDTFRESFWSSWSNCFITGLRSSRDLDNPRAGARSTQLWIGSVKMLIAQIRSAGPASFIFISNSLFIFLGLSIS